MKKDINVLKSLLVFSIVLHTCLPISAQFNYQAGWPLVLPVDPAFKFFSNLTNVNVADIDGDNKKEIIFPISFQNQQYVVAFNHRGQLKDYLGFPILVGDQRSSEAKIRSMVSDLDQDGRLEIIVTDASYESGRVICFGLYHGRYTKTWEYRLNPDSHDPLIRYHIDSTPTVGNIIGDKKLEIIFTATDNTASPNHFKVFALQSNGDLVTGFPAQVSQRVHSGFTINSSIGLVNIDDDALLEVIVVPDLTTDYVQAVDGNGAIFSTRGWPMGPLGDEKFKHTNPIAGDLDNDGDQEIIIVGQDAHLYILGRLNNGPNWHVDRVIVPTIANETCEMSDPILADLDGDRDLEIIYAGEHGFDKIIAYHHDGSVVQGWPVSMVQDSSLIFDGYNSPVAGDVDGDKNVDVIFLAQDSKPAPYSQPSEVFAFNGSGQLLTGWPYRLPVNSPRPDFIHPLEAPIITDLDKDGDVEIIVPYFYEAANLPGRPYVGFSLHIDILDLPSPHSLKSSHWPMYQHDIGYTGNYQE